MLGVLCSQSLSFPFLPPLCRRSTPGRAPAHVNATRAREGAREALTVRTVDAMGGAESDVSS